MAGHPPGPAHSYGSPSAPPYTAAPQSYNNTSHQPYNNTSHQPYGNTSHQPYSNTSQQPYSNTPYSNTSQQPYGNTSQQPYGNAQYQNYGAAPQQNYGVASPFAALVPSVFPPGTDPNVVACFRIADQDGSGLVDDKELQRALSTYNQSFSLRTVQLLMCLFTSSNARRIGPKEFIPLFYCLQSWRVIFERFDRDRSGKIDKSELREALMSLGYAVSPSVLDLLLSKFDKSGGKSEAIEYDNFIECCLTVKGLTEKFKEKDTMYTGSATFTYESFMLTVLQFLIA